MTKNYSFAALKASGAGHSLSRRCAMKMQIETPETLAIRCSGGQQTAAFFWKFEKFDARRAPLQPFCKRRKL
jgi:hypothetical protein